MKASLLQLEVAMVEWIDPCRIKCNDGVFEDDLF